MLGEGRGEGMTDKQTLLAYRLKQAEETFVDAEKMLLENEVKNGES